MTVKELREAISHLPEDAVIVIAGPEYEGGHEWTWCDFVEVGTDDVYLAEGIYTLKGLNT